MTKVVVIDVELGPIDRMIAEDIAEIHGEAKLKLEQAIAQRKAEDNVRKRRETEKQVELDLVQTTLELVHQKLLGAGADGLSITDVAKLITPAIANTSAFSLRMKTFLRNAGNIYVLKKFQKDKVARYTLAPFNLTDE